VNAIARVRNDACVAWEWVNTVGTAAVGLAGIAATYLSGKRQVTSARQVARDQADASLRAQREDRNQRRIEVAYPQLLGIVADTTEWLERAATFMDGNTGEEPPDPPEGIASRTQSELDDGVSISMIWSPLVKQGWLAAVCSPQIQALTGAWSHEVAAAVHFTKEFAYVRATPPGAQILREHFRRHHMAASEVEGKLRAQAWRELRGEDAGYVPGASSDT